MVQKVKVTGSRKRRSVCYDARPNCKKTYERKWTEDKDGTSRDVLSPCKDNTKVKKKHRVHKVFWSRH